MADGSRFRFLFRTDEGRIDRAVWWRGTWILAIPLAVLFLIWLPISPWIHRTADERALTDLKALTANLYLLGFGFCALLIAISHYNLSAKRWRDRGRPPAFAGILPVTVLVTAAAHWLHARTPDVAPFWMVTAWDALLVAVIVWNVVELGCLGEKDAGGGKP